MDLPQFFQMIVHFDRYLGTVTAQYGAMIYALMFAIVFCEMAFVPLFFLPGDPLLFIGGTFCATGGMNAGILIAALFCAAVCGSTVNYWIGNAIGKQVLTRNDKWLNQDALHKTHAFYEIHGGTTFILSPFIAVVRTFAPFIAGVSRMTFSKFQMFNIAGAAIWVVSLVAGGYFFGNIPLIRNHLNTIVLGGIGAGVGALVIGGMWKFFRKRNGATVDPLR